MAQRAAIVTGGSSGIGLAIAHLPRAKGYDVNAVRGNVADEALVHEVVGSHRERFDALINNAGIGSARRSPS